jgi:hypothetical protein
MGIGATYKILTLNLAYGFGFLNPEKGKDRQNILTFKPTFMASNGQSISMVNFIKAIT